MADQNFTTQELESEEWRDVVGYEGLYSVSSIGRVRRDARYNGRGGLRKCDFNKRSGYWRIELSKDNRKRKYLIHQLVAASFIGPCPPRMEVNHKDARKTNNRADNLEYVTRRENSEHAHKHGLCAVGDRHWKRQHPDRTVGELNPACRLTSAIVADIKRQYRDGTLNQRQAARRYGVAPTTINAIVKGVNWSHIP